MVIRPVSVSGLPDLRRNLRSMAQRIIDGRKSFEEHTGRRATKPLQQVAIDPRDALELLDDLAAAEAAVARVEARAKAWASRREEDAYYGRAVLAALKGGDDE